ncbi:MAG TPA: alpha/beta fold hydrolase, partial [Chloroflexota bacterium]|nr:alpha/beta fold hydrolase [Chloroflexota bacterium]
MATFVLVHGAWHGGWCWRKLTPLLAAAGHQVLTPTLTGLGERVHLAGPEVGLGTHVQDVVGVLEFEDVREAILVGHSYGGMVIAGAAGRAAERLSQLVYLDAYVPEHGQAMTDLVPAERLEGMRRRVRDEGQGWLLPSFAPEPWEVTVRDRYLVSDESEVRWVASRLVGQPFKTMTDPVHDPEGRAAALPRAYIRCPRYPNPAFDRYAAEASAA